jgi:hypothetical protein
MQVRKKFPWNNEQCLTIIVSTMPDRIRLRSYRSRRVSLNQQQQKATNCVKAMDTRRSLTKRTTPIPSVMLGYLVFTVNNKISKLPG